jgi:hypothetical protein
MEDTTSTPPVVTPGDGAGKKNTKLIIVVAVVVFVLFVWQGFSRFAGEKMVERAMEQAGGGDVNYDLDADGEGTITITGEEGDTYEYSAGGSVALPDSWPSDMPIIDGAELGYAGSASPAEGESATMVSLTTTASMDAVTSYYQKALTDNGWTVVSTVNMGTTVMLAGTKGEREVGVYIAGEKGATAVTITISG